MDNLIEQIEKRFNALKSHSDYAIKDLQTIAEYFQPEKAKFFGQNSSGSSSERSKIYDSTPEEALQTLAAALHSLLTSPVHTWFNLALTNGLSEADKILKAWIEDCETKMMAKFNSEETGFQTSVHELWMDLPSFGTAVFFCDDHKGKVRYKCIPLSEIQAIGEDAFGVIDTVFRVFRISTKQIMELFGTKDMPDCIKDAIDKKEFDRTFEVVHYVGPRENYKENSKDPKKFPIASVYYIKGDKKILRESGFHEMPYMVPRWSKTSGEVWGRGAGHKSLPDVQVLNEVARSEMIAIDKASDPAVALPYEGFVTEWSSDGGALNYHRSQGDIREKVMVFGSDANLPAIEAAIMRKQDSIRRMFLNDKLQMVGGPQMTATEVNAIQNEKMRILGPVLGRLQAEFLALLINRTFNIMLRNGELLDPPEEIQGEKISIKYVSPISRAQKQTDADAVTQAIMYMNPFIQINPGILDNFDFDAIARDTQDLFGYRGKYLKDPATVKKGREAQQEQQAQAQGMQDQSNQMALAQQAKELRDGQEAQG
jgi:hypothetical protein